MGRFPTKKLVMCALFTVLACVATTSIRIPAPRTSGCIHPGDAVVIFCGIFMGPAEAFLAAGISSSMTDLLDEYFIYVPVTFITRGLVAYLSSRLHYGLSSQGRNSYLAVARRGVIDMAAVAEGYFLCEVLLYGTGTALASALSNLVQGTGGSIIAYTLYPVLRRPLEAAMAA